ncbi:T9SS type A sorting domain-containing protein [Pedobacter lithocola]|uniref:Secretion system C-terminal sorting domain-containing protein n=2 Tax=Pedobacter TaxID=84567 RepID=A0A3N0BR42_9SPHI|nr:T9SS type A sorting domain-containing protein [Pedobacter jejuensis]RNL51488.1 hypothetical protein D7004_14330 [Pedobacter jejuensis]
MYNASLNKHLISIMCIVTLMVTSISVVSAQIASRNSKEKVFYPKLKGINVERRFSISDEEIRALSKQDSIEKINGYPFRFGKDVSADIDFIEASEKRKIGDSSFCYLSVSSPKAFSINLIFDKLRLGNSAFINIYNDDNTFAYGPITSKDIQKNGVLWTDLIKGDKIIIELVTTGDVAENSVHISRIIHGYRNTFTPNVFGDALACNNDIACPVGSTWRDDANSVAMILLANGTRLCTGALINSVPNDYKPYFLTAFHCLDGNSDANLSNTEQSAVNNWLFRFRYESPTCNGTDGTDFVTFSGADLRSAHQATDMTLLELYNNPAVVGCISFAGWTKSATAPSSATTIHHPAGDVKKISFDNNSLITNSSVINWFGGTTSPVNSHWVVGLDNGTSEGGSSGAPLFDQDHKIVGQLHGGENGCAPITKYYGRFDLSWNGGGTNATRLSNWLDPSNTGTNSLNTVYPGNISGPKYVCQEGTFSITNLPNGATFTWSIEGAGGTLTNIVGNQVTLNKTNDGISVLKATVTTNCGSYVLESFQIRMGVPYSVRVTELYCEDGCGGTLGDGTILLCGEPNLYSDYNNLFKYDIGQIPAFPVELNYYIQNINGIFFQSKIITTTQTGIIYLPEQMPLGFYNLEVWLSGTECIEPMWEEGFVAVSCNTSNIVVYPNPASNELRIGYKKIGATADQTKNNDLKEEKDFSVKLFNKNGVLLKEAKTTAINKEIQLQVSDLPNDTYFLHILQDKEIIKKQVIVQH